MLDRSKTITALLTGMIPLLLVTSCGDDDSCSDTGRLQDKEEVFDQEWEVLIEDAELDVDNLPQLASINVFDSEIYVIVYIPFKEAINVIRLNLDGDILSQDDMFAEFFPEFSLQHLEADNTNYLLLIGIDNILVAYDGSDVAWTLEFSEEVTPLVNPATQEIAVFENPEGSFNYYAIDGAGSAQLVNTYPGDLGSISLSQQGFTIISDNRILTIDREGETISETPLAISQDIFSTFQPLVFDFNGNNMVANQYFPEPICFSSSDLELLLFDGEGSLQWSELLRSARGGDILSDAYADTDEIILVGQKYHRGDDGWITGREWILRANNDGVISDQSYGDECCGDIEHIEKVDDSFLLAGNRDQGFWVRMVNFRE